MIHTKQLWGLVILLAMLAVGVTPALAQDDSGVQATVAPDFVFLRESPGTSSDSIGEFPRGLSLTVHGREDRAGNGGLWVLVTPTSGGPTGWVLIDLLNFDGAFVISSLPIIDPSSTDAPATSGGTTTTSDDDGGTTDEGGTTTSTAATGEGLPGETNQLANLRTGPELTFDIVGQFPANTDVTFVGRNANNVWLYVVVEEQAGWFFSGLVDVDGDVNSLPVVNADGTRADSGAAVVTTTTTTTSDGGSAAPAASSGSSANIFLRTQPGSNPRDGDGRLSAATADLGGVVVYCVTGDGYTNAGNIEGGGIVVLRTQGENPGIVLFAPESVIDAAKVSRPSGALATGSGLNLFSVEGNILLLTGTDSAGHPFAFQWENCNQGRRVD